MGRHGIEINVLKDIFTTLRKRKVNTLLAMGGVFLGVLILLVCSAAYSAFMSGSFSKSLQWDVSILMVTTDGNFSMDYDDIRKIKEHFPGADCGCVEIPSGKSIIYGPAERSASAPVCFMEPQYYDRMMLGMLHGRFLNRSDLELKRKVCVLGKTVSDKLFGENADPCGCVVVMDNVNYTVVGVMYKPIAPIDSFGNEEEMVFIPYPTADVIYGLDGRITKLLAFFPLNNDRGQNVKELRSFLKHIHKADDLGYDLSVKDCTDLIMQWSVAFIGAEYLILILGIGMIIAGLLNLFNIIYVSVNERKEEFGIRLSIGATPDLLVKSVMTEGAIMSMLAGLAAIMFALLIVVTARCFFSIELVGKPYLPLSLCGSVLLIMVSGGAFSGFLCIRKIVYTEVKYLMSKSE